MTQDVTIGALARVVDMKLTEARQIEYSGLSSVIEFVKRMDVDDLVDVECLRRIIQGYQERREERVSIGNSLTRLNELPPETRIRDRIAERASGKVMKLKLSEKEVESIMMLTFGFLYRSLTGEQQRPRDAVASIEQIIGLL